MIERGHALPLARQAEVLKLSRSSLYYRPRPVSAADLAVMRRIDELHLDYPFAGSGMLCDLLRGEGVAIGRQRVSLPAARRDGRAAEPGVGDGHHLRAHGVRLRLSRRRGRLVQPPGPGLAALDHHGGRVLSRGGRGSVGKAWPAGDLQHRPEPAPAKAGGSQFTSADFTGRLLEKAIAISMDGKGSWRDNVFVERLWRSVKYEEVYC